eukprot:CAMPEP_0174344456 /NCGR_PEP_ID=MMETSP0810-20121108/27670_1 /TAXON_ID=73025 ORGANISM="Eutreptiella gymnastica-like, Strain CCMP1594" /NCGR_SAMPLE_ID=MMETSP0810 /ASSEMBLY_ACC=CAM_ASM_000659 /LENGTH=372 /DNA_ID=CAMNT_0015467591 /DNA_START=16 /DNA_END=1130 /DNA_ORIENTATION=+
MSTFGEVFARTPACYYDNQYSDVSQHSPSRLGLRLFSGAIFIVAAALLPFQATPHGTLLMGSSPLASAGTSSPALGFGVHRARLLHPRESIQHGLADSTTPDIKLVSRSTVLPRTASISADGMLDTDLPHDRNENEAVPEQRGILSTVLAPFLTLFGPLAWAVGALWRGISKMAKRKADHLLREDVALGTSPLPKTQSFFATLWDFSRPHTLIGSALCIPALHYFAAPTLQAAVAPTVLWSCLTACLPAFLINIVRAAIVTVCVCLVLGLGLVPLVYANVPFLQPFATEALQATLLGSAFLGTIYSLSPFRLKRFPLLAATCIFSVRGLLINVGFYAHALVSSFGGLGGTLLSLPLRDVRCGMAALFFVVFG